jgi:hypothetical protein
MHISFKIIKIYFTLCCSTCFGHHCVRRQELLIAAHAVSGHRVVLGRLFPPAKCPKHVKQHKVKGNFMILKLMCIWLVFIQY